MMTTRQIKIVNFSALPWLYLRVFPQFCIFLCSELLLSSLRLNFFFLPFLLLCSREKSSEIWVDRFCSGAVNSALAAPMTRLFNFYSDFDFITCEWRTRRKSIEQLIINLIQSNLIYFRQLPFMLFIWISVGDWRITRITSRRSIADTCGNGCATVWWWEMFGAWSFY